MRGVSRYTSEAEAVLTRCLGTFQDGGLFLILIGRLKRLSRDVAGGFESYQRIVALKLPWSQLNDMVNYELAWRYLSILVW